MATFGQRVFFSKLKILHALAISSCGFWVIEGKVTSTSRVTHIHRLHTSDAAIALAEIYLKEIITDMYNDVLQGSSSQHG